MDSSSPRASKKARIIGWVLSLLPAPLYLFSAAFKFMHPPDFVKGFEGLGWPARLAVPLGVVELGCLVVFLVPRTAVLGAILMTGYMGGAMATHLRIGEAWYLQALLAVVLWVGLYLREPRLRELAPLLNPAG